MPGLDPTFSTQGAITGVLPVAPVTPQGSAAVQQRDAGAEQVPVAVPRARLPGMAEPAPLNTRDLFDLIKYASDEELKFLTLQASDSAMRITGRLAEMYSILKASGNALAAELKRRAAEELKERAELQLFSGVMQSGVDLAGSAASLVTAFNGGRKGVQEAMKEADIAKLQQGGYARLGKLHEDNRQVSAQANDTAQNPAPSIEPSPSNGAGNRTGEVSSGNRQPVLVRSESAPLLLRASRRSVEQHEMPQTQVAQHQASEVQIPAQADHAARPVLARSESAPLLRTSQHPESSIKPSASDGSESSTGEILPADSQPLIARSDSASRLPASQSPAVQHEAPQTQGAQEMQAPAQADHAGRPTLVRSESAPFILRSSRRSTEQHEVPQTQAAQHQAQEMQVPAQTDAAGRPAIARSESAFLILRPSRRSVEQHEAPQAQAAQHQAQEIPVSAQADNGGRPVIARSESAFLILRPSRRSVEQYEARQAQAAQHQAQDVPVPAQADNGGRPVIARTESAFLILKPSRRAVEQYEARQAQVASAQAQEKRTTQSDAETVANRKIKPTISTHGHDKNGLTPDELKQIDKLQGDAKKLRAQATEYANYSMAFSAASNSAGGIVAAPFNFAAENKQVESDKRQAEAQQVEAVVDVLNGSKEAQVQVFQNVLEMRRTTQQNSADSMRMSA